MKKHSFYGSLCPANQQQKPQSSLRLGTLKASAPERLLLQRSVFFTDTGKARKASLVRFMPACVPRQSARGSTKVRPDVSFAFVYLNGSMAYSSPPPLVLRQLRVAFRDEFPVRLFRKPLALAFSLAFLRRGRAGPSQVINVSPALQGPAFARGQW